MLKQVVVAFLLASLAFGEVPEDTNKTFVPTKDWVEIKEGQSVPAGIHVRINLTTGKKEGKLLDESESKPDDKFALSVTDLGIEEPKSEEEESRKRLEEALKNIPHDSFDWDEKELKETTKKFRTYQQIKKDFDELHMGVKSDFEMLGDLLKKYTEISGKESASETEVKNLFDDLEYLVHQIDNANQFISQGGLETVVLPNLQNQTNTQMKLNSIKLLGTLTQNNPSAQIAAFERNVGFVLLQVLAHSTSPQEMSSVIFAFGGLIRKFPLAQKELLNKPGMKVLVDLLARPTDYKVKIKTLKLISDLIREFDETTQFASEFDKEKIRQYQEVNVKQRIRETDFCNYVDELMSANRHEYLANQYVTEDIVSVLVLTKDSCREIWDASPIFRHTLLVIKNKYDKAAEKSPKDEDLRSLTKALQDLNDFLFEEAESSNVI